MNRILALLGALAIGFVGTSTLATEKTTKSITATISMMAPDQSHLIGYKNGNITVAASAQIDACVFAFLDGKIASLQAGESLKVEDEFYQELERETCAEEAVLPSGEKYCRKYGPVQNLVGQITHLKSTLTARDIQIFCVARGNENALAIAIREQSFGTLFAQTID
jgi:hypothetical protein